MSEYYGTSFAQLTQEAFSAIHDTNRCLLHGLLRHQDVFVAKEENVSITKALFESVQNELLWLKTDSRCRTGDPDTVREVPVVHPFSITSFPPHINETTVIDNIRGFSSSLENIFKAYNYDSDRYNGTVNDGFKRKFALYLDRCDQNNLNIDACRRAFSIILCGRDREFNLKYFVISSLRCNSFPIRFVDNSTQKNEPELYSGIGNHSRSPNLCHMSLTKQARNV